MRKLARLFLITSAALSGLAGQSDAGDTIRQPGRSFAVICAAREVQVITLIEDDAGVVDFAAGALTDAAFGRLDAQAACYEGRVGDAVAMYDRVIDQLSPMVLRAAR